jgi:hypothetical protein
MRFNPPPNWPPAPTGWTPPPGWQPDPSWPPVPPGWQLWVPDAPRRKTGLIIGAVAAFLLVVVGVVVAVVVATSNDAPVVTGSGPTTTSTQPAGEESLRDVIDQFQQAWNDEDFDTLTELMCEDMRNDPEFDASALVDLRDEVGRMDLTVNSVDVNGNSATANLTQRGEEPEDIGFVRESGDWKWCDF